MGTSCSAPARLSAPPCERITAPDWESASRSPRTDGGDAEAVDQLLHRDTRLLLDEVEDLAAALLHQQARLARCRHVARIITSRCCFLSFAFVWL
jgi:hypothetical protein